MAAARPPMPVQAAGKEDMSRQLPNPIAGQIGAPIQNTAARQSFPPSQPAAGGTPCGKDPVAQNGPWTLGVLAS